MRTFILEPSTASLEIPGTIYLDEKGNTDVEVYDNLKRLDGTSIVLNPQPSDSPKDPYNWSSIRKVTYFISLLISSIFAAVIGPIIAPAISDLAVTLNVSLSSGIQLNGSLVMALGVSAYVCGQLSNIYGKRFLFLLSNFAQVLFCIWAATSHSYKSLLASRIFMGGAMGMAYSVAGTASISDVFFVHERGRYVGIWTFTILSVNNITPIVSGYLIEALNWRWSFGIGAIMFFIALVTAFFFLPETGFKRDHLITALESVEISSSDDSKHVKCDKESKSEKPSQKNSIEKLNDTDSIHNSETYTIKDSLKLYNGRVDDRSLSTVLLRPFILLRNPIVLWGVLQWCLCYLWVIVIGTISSQMFTVAPYNFTIAQTGVISGVPPLIGTLIGTGISGVLSDFLVDYLSKKNKGMCECEFRLFMMIPYIILVLIGSFGLGFAIHDSKSWIIVSVYLAVLFTGVAFGCNAIISYTIDALNEISGEAFGIMMLGKSCFVFGLLFIIPTWYATHGSIHIFVICGSISAGVGLLTIPMYVFGKKSRATFSLSYNN